LWRRWIQGRQLLKKTTSLYFQDEERNYVKQSPSGKQRSPATIGTVRLDSSLQINQGPFLSVQPSHCFTIPFYLSSQKLKTLAFLDFVAFACFLDEVFTRLYKIPIVKKLSHVHIEVIDGWPLFSGDVTHKTMPLEVKFGNHSSSIGYNIIRTPSAPVILGLSWLGDTTHK
jgi:hypothetical protein